VHRTTFTRQAANLWAAKKLMWGALLGRVEHEEGLLVVHSFCVPVCSFAKAPRHKSFAAVASYGHDAMRRGVFSVLLCARRRARARRYASPSFSADKLAHGVS
jgi:hypothetical protein